MDRLKAARKKAGLTQAQIGKKLGVAQNTYSYWERGLINIDIENLKRIAELLGVSAAYLLGNDTPSSPIPEAVDPEVLADYVPDSELHPIRIIGTVRAGYDGLAFEDHEGYELSDVHHPEDYFYLRVSGYSMAPRINPGDLALVRCQPMVESGDVAVVILGDDESTIKRFIKNGNSIVLQPFNTDYQPRILTPAEAAEMRIVGKVVETIRKERW